MVTFHGRKILRLGGSQGGASPGLQGGLKGVLSLDGGRRTVGAPPEGRSMSSRGRRGEGSRKSGKLGGVVLAGVVGGDGVVGAGGVGGVLGGSEGCGGGDGGGGWVGDGCTAVGGL